MTESDLINSVASKAPSEELAEAVYALEREIGLSHEEIFGRQQTVSVEKPVSRSGLIGGLLEKLFGKMYAARNRVVEGPGMNVKTFLTYMELLDRAAKEQKRQSEKQSVRDDVRSLGGPV